MATGGGHHTSKQGKQWPDTTPNTWRQAIPDSQSSDMADEEAQSLRPDQEIEKDLSDLSLHKEDDQEILIIPGEQVSNDLLNPNSHSDSSQQTDSENSPYTSASESNQTAIFIQKSKGAVPKTSTPLSDKNPKSHKKVTQTSLNTDTPPINRYFCRTSKVGETVPSPVPPPNILDWYEAVDNQAHKYENSPLTVLGKLEPLPQRTESNASKQKRINSDGKSITTANSKDGTLNSTTSNTAQKETNRSEKGADSQSSTDEDHVLTTNRDKCIPWLLNAYSNDQPLPETLIGT